MESEDEQKAEITWMAQAPLRKAAASSWVRRTGRHCKKWFLQSKVCWLSLLFGFVLVAMVIVFAVKTQTSHHGKFPPEQCPSEWIGYKRRCYFISEEQKNWTSSRTFCAKNESLLAIFENQEEMHSLAKRLKIDDSWIGLRKKGESFYWENGIPFKEDSFQIRNHSECAYLDAFTISTSACSLPRRWICIHLP
ncbi:C-type lectin domain family 2 member B-like [Pluvialis apricaria]